MSEPARHGPSVLVVGYNGANNTGAEALLQTDLRDLRSVLPHAQVTVPTLSRRTSAGTCKRPDLRIEPMPTLFFRKPGAWREHDLIMLVRAAPTWTPGPRPCFVASSGYPGAHSFGKPCLAYAVDAGDLSPSTGDWSATW